MGAPNPLAVPWRSTVWFLPLCCAHFAADTLRIELLQLSTLLIDTVSNDFVDHRKELIKFAWHHLKAEDIVTKNWAYVNVCRFIEVGGADSGLYSAACVACRHHVLPVLMNLLVVVTTPVCGVVRCAVMPTTTAVRCEFALDWAMLSSRFL